MSDNSSILPSPSGKHTNPLSSLFGSPKLFMGFSSKSFLDTEASMSPTSILETKPFSVVGNNSRKSHWAINGDSRGAIGLAIVDALTKEKTEKKTFNQSSRMVLFGSQLKIQIPTVQSNSISPTGSVESPDTPIEFSLKNKNPVSFVGEVRPSPRVFTKCLSPREMELSEDYTCVISYGPNPKKTHIFDNCILESCGDGFMASKEENRFSTEQTAGYSSGEDFLSFCHACRKSLAQGKDIFMYRGERAFCSHECRQKEMISDAEEAESRFEDLLDLF
ncbi:protein MARD1-like [Phalaenopsis equestris]|uniref:protein MARD1-like n=1 Tax=Phalaenopsis equestris TaxID=78828 RepID=UPI0009E6399A|nr:protein MARD1-like [Phalaenopsis equestris]